MLGLRLCIFTCISRLSWDPKRTTTYLTTEQERLWMDGLFLPAVYAEHQGEDGTLQHLPASYDAAKAATLAQGTEKTVHDQAATPTRLRLLRFALQPEKLSGIWTRIAAAVQRDDAFRDFRGLTLFAHAKNLKLRFTHESLPKMRARWQQLYGFAVDSDYIDNRRAFIDFAKQVTARGSHLKTTTHLPSCEPQSMLFKRCCLESYCQAFSASNSPSPRQGKKPIKSVYTVACLRDAANLTLYFPEGSIEEQHGLVYAQLYSTTKAPFDAGGTYCFENQNYETLAIDPRYAKVIQYAGGHVIESRGRSCEKSYLHSKKRAHLGTQDALHKSYGTREEYRMSLRLFDAVVAGVTEHLAQQDAAVAPNCDYFYSMPSQIFFGFLRSQINKYCLGFEYLYARSSSEDIRWEQSQLMILFLRMLRLCSTGALLGRETAVYKDTWKHKKRNGQVVDKEGLGLKGTIERYGFGWFCSKISWKDWAFRPEIAGRVLLENLWIQDQYQKRWQAVQGTVDIFGLIKDARAWAVKFPVVQTGQQRQRWLEYLTAINLQQFHKSIFLYLKDDIRPEFKESALAGMIPLCWDALAPIFQSGEPHLVTGNRMRVKQGPAELVDRLFDFSDGVHRGAWHQMPYRFLYEKSFQLVESAIGRPEAEGWARNCKKLVVFTCWLLPYPCSQTFFDRTKPTGGRPSKRMWFSSFHGDPSADFDEQTAKLERLYESRAHSDQGDGMQALLRLADQYSHWTRGRGEVLRGRPLKLKVTPLGIG